MPLFYLDTSALLKKYRTESGTDLIIELFEKAGEIEALITSYFTVLEVTSVARRLLAAGTISRRLYERMLGNFERDVSGLLLLQSVSDAVVREAIRVTASHVLRAPDAVHLATALRAKNVSEDTLYFVCSDLKLLTACRHAGLASINPEAPGALDSLRQSRSGG